jgi:hypothetical protein
VRLPNGTDVDRLADECERDGLVIAPGSEWSPAGPAGPFVRLNYAGPTQPHFRQVRASSAGPSHVRLTHAHRYAQLEVDAWSAHCQGGT